MESIDPARPHRLGDTSRAGRADAVVVGGRVFTGLGDPLVEAVAIRDGLVVTAGQADDCVAAAGPGARIIDVEGRTVVPGLVDSHVHLVRSGLTWASELRWDEVPSLADALSLVNAAAAQRPPGSWISVVGGWHHGQFKEGREPTRAELDSVAPEHPVYVQLLYERGLLNSAGIRACGLTADTPDPARGRFARDDAGEPTGAVEGMPAFGAVLGAMPDLDHEGRLRSLHQLCRELAGYGLTGAIDPGGLGMTPETYEPLFELWRRSALPMRVRLYVCPTEPGSEETDIGGLLRHQTSRFGDDWLRFIGIGEIVVFGCHDLEGLRPHEIDGESKAMLRRIATRVARRGWPLHMHAVLDSTISDVLDVWEDVDAEVAVAPLRWSLAHADAISDRNVERVRALGIGVGVQNRLVYRAADSAAVWGDPVVATGPPLRSLLDGGVPVGAGTDGMRVASPNPWVSLWWLTTGKNVDGGPRREEPHRLTREEALHTYTAGSAWFSFDEGRQGTLRPGAFADLAVLSEDYFSVPEDEIRGLRSVLTLVDGRPVHAEAPFTAVLD